jgi:Ca2+-binding EF-hand superfamily protein
MPEGLSEGVAIEGMQQFAAAVWARQQHIPSAKADPLSRIFSSFDTDQDGHLTAKEVAAALRSRNVDLTEAIVQKFIEASDADSNDTVERDEFAALILHMASADLRSKEVQEYWAREECGAHCALPDS